MIDLSVISVADDNALRTNRPQSVDRGGRGGQRYARGEQVQPRAVVGEYQTQKSRGFVRGNP